jgi:hypothetical protein
MVMCTFDFDSLGTLWVFKKALKTNSLFVLTLPPKFFLEAMEQYAKFFFSLHQPPNNVSSIEWTTSGDGVFADPLIFYN